MQSLQQCSFSLVICHCIITTILQPFVRDYLIINHPLSASSTYYDLQHLSCSIYMLDTFVADIGSPGWAGLSEPLGCISNTSHAILGSQVASRIFWTGCRVVSILPGLGRQVLPLVACLSVRMCMLPIQSVLSCLRVITILTAV